MGVSVCSSIWQTTRCCWAVAIATWTGSSRHGTFSIVWVSTGTSSALPRCLGRVRWAFWTRVWIAAWRWWLSCRRVWVRVLFISPACSRCIINSVDTWILVTVYVCDYVFGIFLLCFLWVVLVSYSAHKKRRIREKKEKDKKSVSVKSCFSKIVTTHT